ncbi:hypothetical protein LIER_40757 [Lithospermum erythrorhizon]|uniref:Stress-response A/B barrel domain-containing protein n=1 Tax=Lithospermum erythrorhizon TaxID=34254 RepID=A0AAV3R0G3_LITER
MSIHNPITIKSQPTHDRRTLEMLAHIRAATHLFSFKHSSTQPPPIRHHFKPLCSFSTINSKSSVNMSSSARQFIEHIVLFKIEPEVDPSKVNSMLSNLNNLVSLSTVLHLSAGPILRQRGSATLAFTHMLHSRYSTKPDLDSYSKHPSHVSVVGDYVKPIVSDVMAVDWVASDVVGEVPLPPGSALRVTFTKLKDNVGEDGKEEILGVIRGIKGKFPDIHQLTLGENFSPERAKGFSIASIAVFKGVNELEGLENESEMANAEKDKVRDSLDGVLVIDYVVPASQTASL